jgi:excisionase family DNA binding protein
MKKVYTTGQVAKICKVAPRTVSKWFDARRLKGYRVPGSQDRRIPREQLLRFLKEYGMPYKDLEDAIDNKVLVVSAEPEFLSILRDNLPKIDNFRVEAATNCFEAGLCTETFRPDCIIIDFDIGRFEAEQIASNLRRCADHQATILIGLTDDTSGESMSRFGFNGLYKKPIDVPLFAGHIRRLIGQKKADQE